MARRILTHLKMTLLSALTAISLLMLITLAVTNGVTANTSNERPASHIQRLDPNGRPQLMVATYCGSGRSKSSPTLYHNQYLEIESRKWRSDRDPTSTCIQGKKELLDYCRKVYPNHEISNIVESSRPYKIENWCKINSPKRRCRSKLTVKPYRCLEGTFQSEALLVPERCLFDHVHNKSICESSDHWNQTATENCSFKEMKLQSFAMLQPCGLDVFSGVEFVCCPSDVSADSKLSKDSSLAKAASTSSEGDSFAQTANNMMGWLKDSKYELNQKLNDIKVDDEKLKKHHDQSAGDEQDDEDDEDEDEYDGDEDEYDDDSSSWSNDKSSSTSTSTTTTTTTERPIDHYLGHFDLAHEHDEFRRAELAVESSYRDKITRVMKDYAELDGRYNELKAKDPTAAEEFKKKMTRQMRKTVEALEEEGAAQRHQLASMHAERAMAIINRRKKTAMECLTQALDKYPIHTRQVELCTVKLLKALEKDRAHTLRQYKNLLNLNTGEALREKKIILDHLVTLNRAANQSIAMLDRSPVLVEKLKGKIVALWHKLRHIPLDEPIVRESELKIMEKYEEEVAQHKIERERQRMLEQDASQVAPQESSSKQPEETNKLDKPLNEDNKATSLSTAGVKEATASQPVIVTPVPEADESSTSPQHLIIQESGGQPRQSGQPEKHSDIEGEIRYRIDSAKFSHLKVDPSHHELSYLVKNEPIEGHQRFGYSALLLSAGTVTILFALISFKYYNKNSTRAYRRQGFAEVGRSCPEEKNVTNMQFNGYENPAYKFFEAEA